MSTGPVRDTKGYHFEHAYPRHDNHALWMSLSYGGLPLGDGYDLESGPTSPDFVGCFD